MSPIRFVLFHPSHPGNIGAAARAIKTMGYSELVLVSPEKEHPHPEARARSSHALDVLLNARVVDTLAEAVEDCALVVGASARRRRLNWPEYNPRECAEEMMRVTSTADAEGNPMPVAIVCGNEKYGLTNDELNLCNALVYIPTNKDYNSLNLAAAVQLLAYEMRMAEDIKEELPEHDHRPATSAEMELLYEHLERVIIASGFLNPDNPRNLMRRLRRLFNRAHLDENELNIMRGILTSLAPGSGNKDWQVPASTVDDKDTAAVESSE